MKKNYEEVISIANDFSTQANQGLDNYVNSMMSSNDTQKEVESITEVDDDVINCEVLEKEPEPRAIESIEDANKTDVSIDDDKQFIKNYIKQHNNFPSISFTERRDGTKDNLSPKVSKYIKSHQVLVNVNDLNYAEEVTEHLRGNCIVPGYDKDDYTFNKYQLFMANEIYIWIEHSKYCIRFSDYGDILFDLTIEAIVEMLQSRLNTLNVSKSFNEHSYSDITIVPKNLLHVTNTVWNQNIPVEFYQDPITKEFTRNEYISINHRYNKASFDEFKSSEALQQNVNIFTQFMSSFLCQNQKNLDYFENSIASYIQTGISPDITIVLYSRFGKAVGIVFEMILSKLFHRMQSVHVHHNDISTTNPKDYLDCNSLIYLSHIPSPIIQDEISKPNVNIDTIVNNSNDFNYVIINTFEVNALEIASNKNGYSILPVNNDVNSYDMLNDINMKRLYKALEAGLEFYYLYLLKRPIDEELLTQPLKNKATEDILKSKDLIAEYVKNIKLANLSYFNLLKDSLNPEHNELFDKVSLGFSNKKPYISKEILTPLYNALESTDIGSATFMKNLRAKDKKFFNDTKGSVTRNFTNADKNIRFTIHSEYNDLYAKLQV